MIEFRYADGRIERGDYEQFTTQPQAAGATLEHAGKTWRMSDREDRDGVTVCIFVPASESQDLGRARRRGRS